MTNNDIITKRKHFPRAIDENDYKVGIEIGVDRGSFSFRLLRDSNLELLYMVDPWAAIGLDIERVKSHLGIEETDLSEKEIKNLYGEETYKDVCEEAKEFGERCELMRTYSKEASEQFEDGYFDFIYIDGDHSYKGCKSDVNLWWPKLREGGMFSGHDYKNLARTKQVKKAVDEFFDPMGIKVNKTTKESCPSFWIIK